jgi:NAD(P)-dependent dehydrogenase (short-subunit alcohol dehydrogenase family)
VHAVETARSLLDRPLDALVHCDDRAAARGGRRKADAAFLTLGAFAHRMIADARPAAAVLVNSGAAGDGSEELVSAAAATYAPRGLRVNVVVPALLRAPVILRFFGEQPDDRAPAEHYPLGRWSEVLDTARTVRWLLSEDAAWINGQVVPVEGGRAAPVAPAVVPGAAV